MGMRVLVVDDEAVMRIVAEGALTEAGYEVESAVSGSHALAIMAVRKFHIVVTDLCMPGMDGRELLKRIHEEHPLTRVIIMTGAASINNLLSCLREGAFAFVIKPITDLETLIHPVHIAAWTVQVWMDQLGELRRLNPTRADKSNQIGEAGVP